MQDRTLKGGTIEYLKFVEMYPAPIRSMHVRDDWLAISRKGYCCLYRIVNHKNQIFFDEVARLPDCLFLFTTVDRVVMVTPGEVKSSDLTQWNQYSYPSQLKTYTMANGHLYTHHEASTLCWSPSDLYFNIASNLNTPFHTFEEGVRGRGKVLKGKYTCCLEFRDHLYVGDLNGTVSIFQAKYYTLVRQIKKHEAAILTIIGCDKTGCIYTSGCDSKIACIRQIGQEFHVTSHCRGQSHDVTALALHNGMLLSGGLTTDICYYSLNNGDFTGQFTNRSCLPSKQLIFSDEKAQIFIINKFDHLQIIRKIQGQNSQYLMKFEAALPITEVAISQSANWIAFSNSIQTTLLHLDIETYALTKHMNLPPAKFINFVTESKCLFITEQMQVSYLKIEKKKISELFRIQGHTLASNFQVQDDRLLVSSQYEGRISVFGLPSGEQLFSIAKNFHLCQLQRNHLVLSYDFLVSVYDMEGHSLVLPVPIRKLRFSGVLPKRHRYWYGIGEGKIVFIYKLFLENTKHLQTVESHTKKTVKVNKVPLVYQHVPHTTRLIFVGIEFSRIVDNIDRPIITKKIM